MARQGPSHRPRGPNRPNRTARRSEPSGVALPTPCAHRPVSGAHSTMTIDQARVLTIRQPWAWAIVFGGKEIENRSWPTKHRGPLLIHAGMAFEACGYEVVRQLATRPPPPASELAHGAIIGAVDLVDCVRDSTSTWASSGGWHWCLSNPQPLAQPVRCPGKLGLWRPPQGLVVRQNICDHAVTDPWSSAGVRQSPAMATSTLRENPRCRPRRAPGR